MLCPFCKTNKDLKMWDEGVEHHLITTITEKGHTHVHGPTGNKELMRTFITSIGKESGFKIKKPKKNKTPVVVKESNGDRKIVFSHKRALGDEVMFTAGVRDFKLLFPEIKVNVEGHHSELWDNNPYLERSIKKEDPGVEFYRVGYPAVGNVNNTALHFTTMFLLDMVAIVDLHQRLPMSLGEFCAVFANGAVGDPDLGSSKKTPNPQPPFSDLRAKYGGTEFDEDCKWPKGICRTFIRQRGDLHMSEDEKAYSLIKDVYNYEKYWIIAPGGKRDCTTKIWDWRKFQEVIDYFKGRIKFVVIGKSDLLGERLNDVIDLVDKFNGNVRGLISLIYHSDGCVSGPSALMHMAAATPPRLATERKPCVSIFGGREPSAWSWYCNHQILHTNGIFSCCDNGGCWTARTIPLQKDPKHNKSLCKKPVDVSGRTVQSCMDTITVQDVIRAIEKYYEGDIYTYLKGEINDRKEVTFPRSNPILDDGSFTLTRNIDISDIVGEKRISNKEINLLGNLNSSGGGEQSLLTIARLLNDSGWKVHLHPWGSVHKNYTDSMINSHSFENGMADNMVPGIPLLFYANDCVGGFVDKGESIVNKSSQVIVGINYVNSKLPKCNWLSKSGKLKAVIFQNEEKKSEFTRDIIGFDNTALITLFGAINLDTFLEACPSQRKKDEPLVVLKHCMPDYRKYTTEDSQNKGDKIHIWQKHFGKEMDVKFYSRMLKDVPDTVFEFMKAHPDLEKAFEHEPRMVFHEWDSMSVKEFLERGHVYLYRTSNLWRDQYPRGIAEALAAGLPVLCEPRDGPLDRVRYGDTGFYCVDYDEYKDTLKKLIRKEDYRHKMGMFAKDWARVNLDPRKWVEVIEGVLS